MKEVTVTPVSLTDTGVQSGDVHSAHRRSRDELLHARGVTQIGPDRPDLRTRRPEAFGRGFQTLVLGVDHKIEAVLREPL
jgi:hypothetical protein